MIFYRVSDARVEEILARTYDLALFASGYEERCTFIPNRMEGAPLEKTVVFGFQDVSDDDQRRENDAYFVTHWGKIRHLRGNDDGAIYELLRETFTQDRQEIRILIDYSSMSRLWYAAVLNWARFSRGAGNIFIDLLYSVGDHKEPSSPLVISEILSVPGCEGLPLPLSDSVAVFGLGFEGSAALSVLDQLEPDELYCYLASPAAFKDYPARARNANKAVISLARTTLDLPLESVERCFAHLAELVSPYREDSKVTLVPMGPKPHVLAAILIAMRFEEITCLHVGYRRHKPERVGTTGAIVATRVHFTKDARPRVKPAAGR